MNILLIFFAFRNYCGLKKNFEGADLAEILKDQLQEENLAEFNKEWLKICKTELAEDGNTNMSIVYLNVIDDILNYKFGDIIDNPLHTALLVTQSSLLPLTTNQYNSLKDYTLDDFEESIPTKGHKIKYYVTDSFKCTKESLKLLNKEKFILLSFPSMLDDTNKMLGSINKDVNWMSKYKYFNISADEFVYDSGFNITVITNDLEINEDKLLAICKQNYEIQNTFTYTKRDFENKYESILNGDEFLAKTFCGFFSLIIKSELIRKLNPILSLIHDSSENIDTLLGELSRIDIQYDNKKWDLVYKLTKKQDSILKCLDLNLDSLTKAVTEVTKTIKLKN
jgi:hypothetical protein